MSLCSSKSNTPEPPFEVENLRRGDPHGFGRVPRQRRPDRAARRIFSASPPRFFRNPIATGRAPAGHWARRPRAPIKRGSNSAGSPRPSPSRVCPRRDRLFMPAWLGGESRNRKAGSNREVRFAADSPLEEAVSSEPVSEAGNSLLGREFTGNFIASGPRAASTAAKKDAIPDAYGPIPYASEQGIFCGLAGNLN